MCALGEGSLDSLFGLLGIVVGGIIYAEYYSSFFRGIRKIASYGRVSLEQLLKVNHWIIILVLVAVMAAFCLWFEKLNK